MNEKELLFITVIGADKKGIVAKISNYLFEADINIEDINQRIMGDGYFVMTMLVDIKASRIAMGDIAAAIEKIGNALAVRIQLQHENIFKMMHRI